MIRKKISIIPLIILILTLTSFVLHKAMLIVPGRSAGLYYINQTSLKNIKSELGKGKITKFQEVNPHCGMTYPYYKIAYPDKGISFTFYTQEVKNNDKFGTIELTKNFDAQTEKGIAIGYSQRIDIFKAYGQPQTNENDIYLEYENLGISFEFANSKNLSTDTLTRIYIYTPQEN